MFPYLKELTLNKIEILNKLLQEIIEKALHPKRMLRLMIEYGEDLIYECYFE